VNGTKQNGHCVNERMSNTTILTLFYGIKTWPNGGDEQFLSDF